MYNRVLNCLFSFSSARQKAIANKVANNYISNIGVQKLLLKKIEITEDARLAIFTGKANSNNAKNSTEAALAELEAAYNSGQMYFFILQKRDSGNYFTQKHRLNEINFSQKVKEHNTYTSSVNDYNSDALRTAGRVGDEMSKSVENHYKSEQTKKQGMYKAFFGKHHENYSDRKML